MWNHDKHSYYSQLLGVSANASMDEIEHARRQFARRFHPDLHPNDLAAEARLKEINAACDALIAAAKRAQSEPPKPDYRKGDVSQAINLTFAEAHAGCSRTFHYHRSSGESYAIKIEIPTRVWVGWRKRLVGQGGPARCGGQYGDLVVIVTSIR